MARQIIIEGPDGSGKTTLAKNLSMFYDIPYMHLGYSKNHQKFLAQFDKILEKIKKGEDFVVDRFVWSNFVYASVFNNQNLIPNYVKCREAAEKLPIIVCLPVDKDGWLKEFERLTHERTELYKNVDMMGEVYDQYGALIRTGMMRGNPLKTFDWKSDTIEWLNIF